MNNFNGWLNIYKPLGISSAKAVSIIKKILPNSKIGHAGTLDVEAAGVLPIGIGEATKLMSFLVEAEKVYFFRIQFGQQTDTGDATGKVIASTDILPNFNDCTEVTEKFIGQIKQIPNSFSALKVGGVRSYLLARQGKEINLPSRDIMIYDLKLVDFDLQNATASYIATCSKGTYIRTLAEQIALSLQSLGFVIELTRLRVGIFKEENSINLFDLETKSIAEKQFFFANKKLEVDVVLDDILVLNATDLQAKQIKFGQKCIICDIADINLIKVNYKGVLLAIGSIANNYFNSKRVFNLFN